jgi:hypothetical protein
MIAWKFLAPGGVAPFTGVQWSARKWLEARSLSGAGVHACALEDLPYWFDDELWRVELAGSIARGERQIVADRGRLLARVEGWPSAAAEFTRACVERTRTRAVDALRAAGRAEEAATLQRELDLDRLQKAAFALAEGGSLASGYLFDTIRRQQYPGLCAYAAANAAAVEGGAREHDRERAAQAAWLSDRLGLEKS